MLGAAAKWVFRPVHGRLLFASCAAINSPASSAAVYSAHLLVPARRAAAYPHAGRRAILRLARGVLGRIGRVLSPCPEAGTRGVLGEPRRLRRGALSDQIARWERGSQACRSADAAAAHTNATTATRDPRACGVAFSGQPIAAGRGTMLQYDHHRHCSGAARHRRVLVVGVLLVVRDVYTSTVPL